MPSTEDCINAKNHVREIAINMVFLQASNSPDAIRELAVKYVNRLRDEELAELTGIKKGGVYSPW